MPASGVLPHSVKEQVAAAWSQLWQALPEKQVAETVLVRMMDTARQSGVGVSSVLYEGGLYQPQPLIWREKISMPLEASYPALRAWIAHVQRQQMISIDKLDIHREDVESGHVKARLQISIWRRSTSAEQRNGRSS